MSLRKPPWPRSVFQQLAVGPARRSLSNTTCAAAQGMWERVLELYERPEETPNSGNKDVKGSEGSGTQTDINQNHKAESNFQTVGSSLEDEDIEGEIQLSQEDEQALAVARSRARAALQNHLQGTTPQIPVVNAAGEGRPGWSALYHDDETGEAMWELDLTAGRVPDNALNALLSRESKALMVVMSREGISTEDIAKYFRVREQRVIAILALQEIDRRREEAGAKMHYEFQDVMEGGPAIHGDGNDGDVGYFDCDQVFGTGERHVKLLPRAPQYESKMDQDGSSSTYEELEAKLEIEEEREMIKEFSDRLAYNMGLVGSSLRRDLTAKNKPERPKQGFSLVVKPLNKGQKPYVANPTGHCRQLNSDEAFFQHRKRIRPRRKLHV